MLKSAYFWMALAFLIALGTREYGWHPICYMASVLCVAVCSGIVGYNVGLEDGKEDSTTFWPYD